MVILNHVTAIPSKLWMGQYACPATKTPSSWDNHRKKPKRNHLRDLDALHRAIWENTGDPVIGTASVQATLTRPAGEF
jgi:hypothetical protein